MSAWGEKAEQMATLREALLPLRERIDSALGDRHGQQPTENHFEAEIVIPQFLADHVSATTQIERAAVTLTREVLEADSVTAGAIYRAVGRLEAGFDGWITAMMAAHRLNPGPQDGRLSMLLAEIFAHSLSEASAWLSEVLDVLKDPSEAITRRGSTDQREVELTLSLTLTAPPALSEIEPELERLRRDIRSAESEELLCEIDSDSMRGHSMKRKKKRSVDLFWLILAIFGLGWLCGDDD